MMKLPLVSRFVTYIEFFLNILNIHDDIYFTDLYRNVMKENWNTDFRKIIYKILDEFAFINQIVSCLELRSERTSDDVRLKNGTDIG